MMSNPNYRVMKTACIAVALVPFFFVSFEASANSQEINESDFGKEWPFTVSEGTLRCSQDEVTFSANGLEYAVNGTATTAGYVPIEPIWEYNMEMISEIAQALDMSVEEAKKSSPMRINIGSVLNAGLELCKG